MSVDETSYNHDEEMRLMDVVGCFIMVFQVLNIKKKCYTDTSKRFVFNSDIFALIDCWKKIR